MEEIKNDLNEIKSIVKDIKAYLKELVGIERDVLKTLYIEKAGENILLNILEILQEWKYKWESEK